MQKSLELAGKLNQPLSITSSPVTFSSSITSKDISATSLSLSSTLTVSGTATSTIKGPLVAGSGNVQIIDSTGRIPALSSTYFASLPNIFASIGNASSTVQFSASGVNDTLSFEATGGFLTISFNSTTKKITFSASAPTLLSVLNQGADASSFTGTTKIGGLTITSSGNLALAGTFAIQGNATSTIDNNLWVKGALTVGASSLGITQSGISSSEALTISPTGTLTLNPSGDLQFFSSANKLSSLGNLTIAGALVVSGTASSTIAGPLNVTGDVITSGKLRESGNAIIPSGFVGTFNVATCPPGWSALDGTGGRPDARGRYVLGLPASGTLAGTTGTVLTKQENRAVGQHNHVITDPGHTHTTKSNPTAGGNTTYMKQGVNDTNNADTSPSVNSNTTGITINNAGSVAGTNAPYIQFLLCQKD